MLIAQALKTVVFSSEVYRCKWFIQQQEELIKTDRAPWWLSGKVSALGVGGCGYDCWLYHTSDLMYFIHDIHSS